LRLVLSCWALTLDGFVVEREVRVDQRGGIDGDQGAGASGYTYAEIGRILGRDWPTVKRYLEHGAQPAYRRKRMPSKLHRLKPLIDQWLAGEPRLLATRIHQDLVRDYGFEGGYDTVRRYVDRSRLRPPRRSEVRFETAPGFQAQVDWSHEQPIRTSSGLELPLYCFHMVLGHSRDSFCRLTGSQDLVTFWACHRAAFAHFGGVPRELLYDRTKTVVRQHVGRDVRVGERIFHPEALASAHHYGFSMRLCQPYRAKTKGKVEHDVPYVRERLLRAHSFTSYEEANVAWRSWNEDVARRRVHGTHGEIVAVRAERDSAALLSLPSAPYLVVERTTRVIARDGFFQLRGPPLPGARREARGARRARPRPGGDRGILAVDRRLLARHERGRPARVLPDPVENSMPLAAVLEAMPDPHVHRRPLERYEEAIRWVS
jgi:transposase